MRLVIAILEPAQVEQARQALADVHVSRMTICDAHGYDLAASAAVAQEAAVEVAVNDDFLDRTLQTLAGIVAAGGHDVRERVRVLPIVGAVQLYREVRGPEAI
jgi:nitrogen regulatory protein PII